MLFGSRDNSVDTFSKPYSKPSYPRTLSLIKSPLKSRDLNENVDIDQFDINNLEEHIEIGFFDNLKTPEDLKLFSPLCPLQSSHDPLVTSYVIMDNRPRITLPVNAADSLQTPIINTDTSAPVFHNVNIDAYDIPQPATSDIIGNFDTINPTDDNLNNMQVDVDINTVNNNTFFPSYSFSPNATTQPVQQQYYNTTPITTNSSEVTYTLLTRSQAQSPVVLPTVIDDHPYPSRNNLNSPAPSTSSAASNGTHDHRERSFFESEESRSRSDSFTRSPNEKICSKQRLTKRDKFMQMCEEQKRLTHENEVLRNEVVDYERRVEILKNYVKNILRQAAQQRK